MTDPVVPWSPASPGRRALAVLLAGWWLVVCWLNLPGHLSVDSLIQIAEGRTGVFESYNPVFISVVFGRLTALGGGTGILVLIATTAFASAVWFMLRGVAGTRSPLALAPAALLLLMPVFLIYPAIIWKDVWFAHAAVLGFALLPLRDRLRAGRRGLLWSRAVEGLCLSLFAFAMLSRQTGVLVSLVGVVALGWIAAPSRSGRRIRMLAGMLARLGVLLALAWSFSQIAQLGVTRVATASGATGVRLVALFDIAGMLAQVPDARLTRLAGIGPDPGAFEAAARRSFSAERIDTLDFPRDYPVWEFPLAQVMAQWADLVIAHPRAYLAHRWEVYAWMLGLRDQSRCLPVHVGHVSGPWGAGAGLDAEPSRFAGALHRYANRFVGTPYFAPAAWGLLSVLVLALACLPGRTRLRTAPGAAAVLALQAAGLIYLASWAPIGFSCDFRYTYFSTLAAGIGLMFLLLAGGTAGGVTDCRGAAQRR